MARPRVHAGVSRPRVSVVIPCFNYGRYLPDAVNSALTQDGVEVEVVVVDDASSDDSPAIARSLAEADQRVRVIAHEVNQGPVVTFNDGLDVATGEFLVRLDADDLLTPGSLRRSVEMCLAHPDVGLVYGRPLHFARELPTPRTRARGAIVWRGSDWLTRICSDGHNVITSPEAFMRMSVVRRTGGQRPLAHTHDLEMWLRLAAFADVAYIVGADQAWHREHDDSLSAREVDHVRDLEERVAAFRELGSGVAGGRPGVEHLVHVALNAVANEAVELGLHATERGDAAARRAEDFARIARDADPEVVGSAGWSLLERRIAGAPIPRSSVLVHSARRRARSAIRMRRWLRTGMWERR